MGSFFGFSELGDAYAAGRRFSSRPSLPVDIPGKWHASDEDAAEYVREMTEDQYAAFQRMVERRAATEYTKINRDGRAWKKLERQVADELTARRQARRAGDWE